MPIVAIPAALALVVALLAVALLLAWEQFANALNNVVPSWHIPGLGSLRGWITSHIQEGYHAVVGYLDPFIKPLVSFIVAPVTVLESLLSQLGALGHDLWTFSYHILTISIPRAVAILREEASGLYRRSVSFANSLYLLSKAYTTAQVARALSFANSLYLLVKAYATAEVARALSFANSLYLLGKAYTTAEVARALSFANDLYLQGKRYAEALTASVRADMAALYRQAMSTIEARYQAALAFAASIAHAEAQAVITSLDGALATDIEQAWPAISTLAGEVTDVAAGAFTDVVSDLQAATRAVPRDLPAAITATLSIAVPLLKLTRDCTMPNCRNLSQVGRDLQSLFGMVDDGLLLGVLAEAAHDPAGTAHAVRDALQPVLTASASTVSSTVGGR